MPLFASALKPEFLYRPTNVWRRLVAPYRRGAQPVQTAFGAPLVVDGADAIGQAILRFGVYDLLLSETLWRLADADDLAVDVGANIGYTAILLAHRSRAVVAFEALPEIAADLRRNVALQSAGVAARITVREQAVADREGPVMLERPAGFAGNRGTGRMVDAVSSPAAVEEVAAVTLDVCFPEQSVGILKIDVEGAEPLVLAGAAELLAARRVRDVVFEAEANVSQVEWTLREAGYAILEPIRRLSGPGLVEPGSCASPDWQPRNLVATTDPERARLRFHRRGWLVLKGD
ncbi:MAG: FkbM family methyltransferase [Candidatus Dadabacteria bacterium]|nr:MAG: FkbM family methyltransferase [Candidatus Dadabacteria bacterium]